MPGVVLREAAAPAAAIPALGVEPLGDPPRRQARTAELHDPLRQPLIVAELLAAAHGPDQIVLARPAPAQTIVRPTYSLSPRTATIARSIKWRRIALRSSRRVLAAPQDAGRSVAISRMAWPSAAVSRGGCRP